MGWHNLEHLGEIESPYCAQSFLWLLKATGDTLDLRNIAVFYLIVVSQKIIRDLKWAVR